MKDKNGNELKVGDRCVFLGSGHHDKADIGKVMTIRAFSARDGGRVRADDGKPEDTDICTSKSYTFSTWSPGKAFAKA